MRRPRSARRLTVCHADHLAKKIVSFPRSARSRIRSRSTSSASSTTARNAVPCSANVRRLMTRPCVANAWQENQRAPFATNALQRVSAGQTHNADIDHQRPLSVPRFPGSTGHRRGPGRRHPPGRRARRPGCMAGDAPPFRLRLFPRMTRDAEPSAACTFTLNEPFSGSVGITRQSSKEDVQHSWPTFQAETCTFRPIRHPIVQQTRPPKGSSAFDRPSPRVNDRPAGLADLPPVSGACLRELQVPKLLP